MAKESLMITSNDIKPMLQDGVNDNELRDLLSHFANIRATRQPLFLNAGDFDIILRWKLRSQYGRQKHWRQANTDEVIRSVTGVALTVTHPDPDYELELRVGLLCILRGVAVPVASAILTLVFPETYGVIDFRAWRQVFGKERSGFMISDYKRYLNAIRPLAQELGCTVQEVDLAIWEMDRQSKR